MTKMTRAVLAVVLTGAAGVAAQGPSNQWALQGEDAQKAAELDKHINELWAAGKFAEAVKPAQELRDFHYRVQGDKHWQAIDAARRLQTLRRVAALPAAQRAALAEVPAILARAQGLSGRGEHAQAEALLRKALAVREQLLGPKHPDTAESYNGLAVHLQGQGRAREAEALYRQALAVFLEVLGRNHPTTAITCSNLAVNVASQGRFVEAEPLLRQVPAVFEQTLGPQHPHTSQSYTNLAGYLQSQGRDAEADPLLRQALAVQEKTLGPKDPRTVTTYNTLAVGLDSMGRFKEAEPLYRQVLAAREQTFGPKHPYTALACNNLAANLADQGQVKEAEPLYRRALAVYEQTLGPRHPSTAESYNNLAAFVDGQGRHTEAELLLRKALAAKEEVLGAIHPDTARGYNNLAGNLQLQGRAAHAEPLWRKSVDSLEAARLRLAASGLDKATAVTIQPHLSLAVCRARLDRPADAWAAAEAGLARGLLDDLAVRVSVPADPKALARDRQNSARRNALDRQLIPLLRQEKLAEAELRRRDDLLRQRAELDEEVAAAAAAQSRQAVRKLADVQAALAADAALVFWVDQGKSGDHWGCVLRPSGPPAWVRLKGSGPDGAWTAADDLLPRRLRNRLKNGEPDFGGPARLLAEQRLRPLEPHLAATDRLPAVRHLVVVPAGRLAAIPLEVLTDRYTVSYAPSGTVFARLREQHRPLEARGLLAVADPNFRTPDAAALPLPEYGLYLAVVLPDGKAARAGLRSGDVLLRYGGTQLNTEADLKTAEAGDAVSVVVWRDGRTLDDLRVAPGKLGVIISDDPPKVALGKHRAMDLPADTRGENVVPLPGTRLEVGAIAALLPRERKLLLLGSRASEQELDRLAAAGQLKEYRLLHLATHGKVDPLSARQSALLLARDQLPGPEEQAKLAAAGKKVPTGRLSVGDVADRWELDADLVVLSACQTALGPDGRGEGLLGFSQVLLSKGARSLVLSLWKVDDTATALLMTRFYQDLLGKRDGLGKPLPKAQALQEAKHWLRTLPRAEVEKLAGELVRRSLRAGEDEPSPKPPTKEVPKATVPAGDTPFAHPNYWAAFILIGDPE
jgi:tetratricopeptide (TPR) repeat protein